MRIAIAGFQHETNTFGVSRAGYDAFEIADSWPRMLIGRDVVPGTRGINLPIAGFAEAAGAVPGLELVPILWCAAEPSAHVTDEAFERIAGRICDGIRDAGPLDGVYLDLHGAMVTESHDDGEGELLARLRRIVGPGLPVAASLDLHANVTGAMVRHATQLAIFRTYPHLDMAATGARCLPILLRQVAGFRPSKAFRQLPYLIPLPAQYTGAEPCRSLYALLGSPDAEATADIALGFSAADTPHTGASVVAYAPSQTEADAMADRLEAALVAAEPAFDCTLLSPEAAVREAQARYDGRPVVIADVQDNPGAGATSDTTGLLQALVDLGVQGAVVALLNDPEMAARAHAAGTGSVVEGALGGKSGLPGHAPYRGRFLVEALSDGNCRYSGEMYRGGTAVLGPCAVLSVAEVPADIRVVVGSQRSQCLDRAILTHIGIDPAAARILCVKSTVHFRADFEPIAAAVLSAAAPGAFPCRLEEVPYARLRPGLRLGPRGPAFQPRSSPDVAPLMS